MSGRRSLERSDVRPHGTAEPSGYKIDHFPAEVLQLEKIFGHLRGEMGDGGQIATFSGENQQHDRKSHAKSSRSAQMLRGEARLLSFRLLVPGHSGDEEQDSK